MADNNRHCWERNARGVAASEGPATMVAGNDYKAFFNDLDGAYPCHALSCIMKGLYWHENKGGGVESINRYWK